MTEGFRAVKLEASWLAQLQPEFQQPYMQQLRSFLVEQKRLGKEVFPPGYEFFNAFAHTPLDQVKVVILGMLL